MSLYAIGDLHLSLQTEKPMDIFGGRWENYVEKIKIGFSDLGDDDLCVICGDISWAMNLEESLEDFRFIDALPGKKIILKGNHDYWWSTVGKTEAFFSKNDITTIKILFNNSHTYGDVSICGTRGWFFEEESDNPEQDRKIMNREVQRLERSIAAAETGEKICFFHYPPRYGAYRCDEILEVLYRNGVQRCYYGHIHGPAHKKATNGKVQGIEYGLVSADFLDFRPKKIID
jgi:predicted phosphohydrolase